MDLQLHLIQGAVTAEEAELWQTSAFFFFFFVVVGGLFKEFWRDGDLQVMSQYSD